MLDERAPLEIIAEIDSTVVEARRRAEAGDYGPVWLLARRQTAGRGRRGRSWTSIEGNLFATYLGRTMRRPADIALLGFAAGVAIADSFDALIGKGRATLKWPNDVMLDRAKAAGIMLDSGAVAPGAPVAAKEGRQAGDASQGAWFALAFGVNIVGAPEHLDQPAQCLHAFLHGAAPPPEDLLADIRPRLEAWTRALQREGFSALRDAWLARAYGLGLPARAQIGEESVQGIMAGLSERGELELETPAGLRRISAGDVHFPELATV